MDYHSAKDYEIAEIFNGGAGNGFWYFGYIHAKEVLEITDQDIGAKSLKLAISAGSLAAAALASGRSYGQIVESFAGLKLLNNLFSAYSKKRNASLEELSRAFVDEDTRFGDLEDLNILVTDITDGIRKPLIMNYQTTPEVLVRNGVRGSSSAHFLFDPLKVKINGQDRIITDGSLSEYNLIQEALKHEYVKKIINIGILNNKNIKYLKNPYLYMAFITGIPREVQRMTEIRETNKEIHDLMPRIPNGYMLSSNMKDILRLSDQGFEDSVKFFSPEH